MKTIIYESGADHRATAEKHFRRAEQKMLDCFKNLKKGYTAEVTGWNLIIRSGDEYIKINLMYTCKWEVYWIEESEIAVIKVDIKGKAYELIFSAPMLFEEDNKIWFVGMRKNREGDIFMRAFKGFLLWIINNVLVIAVIDSLVMSLKNPSLEMLLRFVIFGILWIISGGIIMVAFENLLKEKQNKKCENINT